MVNKGSGVGSGVEWRVLKIGSLFTVLSFSSQFGLVDLGLVFLESCFNCF
jgi:hypothetical protein